MGSNKVKLNPQLAGGSRFRAYYEIGCTTNWIVHEGVRLIGCIGFGFLRDENMAMAVNTLVQPAGGIKLHIISLYGPVGEHGTTQHRSRF